MARLIFTLLILQLWVTPVYADTWVREVWSSLWGTEAPREQVIPPSGPPKKLKLRFDTPVVRVVPAGPPNPFPPLDPDNLKTPLPELCETHLSKLPGRYERQGLKGACRKVELIPSCRSVEGVPIYHYDRQARRPGSGRVLVLALIHGDEKESGAVARAWMIRLEQINPRNQWRIIPYLNPDGIKRHTRMNARGVDLNRNFPSSDWDDKAIHAWKTLKKSDPRRYPGPSKASEPETKCLITHLEDFQPTFVISVHTPLGVLDFDGPQVSFPRFRHLPWISLGTFPGSLGRYLWHDQPNPTPVLTIELKSKLPKALDFFDQLQDASGLLAIRTEEEFSPKNSMSKKVQYKD